MLMASASEEPSGSRVFVVCGRAVESDLLHSAFAPCGNVENIKLVKEKGVAYVKFDRASAAALAIEQLNGAVLNNGKGPKLKVLLAESPTARGLNQPRQMMEPEVSSDPDNTPPRSRLFIVVPKQAEAQQLQDEIAKFPDVFYCKTDLIASKGVVFCKFTKASSALAALEQINMMGTIAGYKVKCMLAEPKTKRGRAPDGSPQHPELFGPLTQSTRLDYNMHNGSMDGLPLKLPVGLSPSAMRGMPDYLSGLAAGNGGGLNNFNSLSGVNNLAEMQGLGGQVGFGFGMNQLGNLQAGSPVSPNNNAAGGISKQRLFVVVHKSVSDDVIARLFRRLPGMEYCDLKKDRATGKSKGYCYINYSTPEAAYAAVDQLNGIEFPPHSGHRIKVMFAEPLGTRPNAGSQMASPMLGLSPNTPAGMTRNMSVEMASMQESLSNMNMHRASSQAELERVMASPVSAVARELMFSSVA